MATIAETLTSAIARLQGVSGTPRQDAQTILGHAMDGKPREYIIAHSDDTVTESTLHIFEKLLTLRAHGMPLAYIVGRRSFYDRDFRINPQVLIPRPETEHIIDTALEWVKTQNKSNLRIIDVGTGSGIIAITLAAHLPDAAVIASDVSAAALRIAQENATGLSNITFLQSDLLASLRGSFDIICTNLPYIATGEMNVLDVAKFEPHVALDGGNDGLVLIRKLLQQAPSQLAKPGLLLLEHGADQGQAVLELAKSAFPTATVSIIKDLAQLDRIVKVEQS